ncbi:MAG: hypothetical protein ABR598_07700 [Candidatus Dormibacteria bacterium]
MAGERALPDLVARLRLDRTQWTAGLVATQADLRGFGVAVASNVGGAEALGRALDQQLAPAHARAGTGARAHAAALDTTSLSMKKIELASSDATRVLGESGAGFDRISGRLSALSQLQGGLGLATLGAAAAFGVTVEAGRSLIENSEKNEKAIRSLEQAYASAGLEFKNYSGQLDGFIQHNAKYISSQYEAKEAMAQLIRAGFDQEKATHLLNNAVDLSAISGESLKTTTEALTSAMIGGRAAALIPFGISMKELNKDHLDAEQSMKDLTRTETELESAHRSNEAAVQALSDAMLRGQVDALNKVSAARTREADANVRSLREQMAAADDITAARLRDETGLLRQLDLEQQLRDERRTAAQDAAALADDQSAVARAQFEGDALGAIRAGKKVTADKQQQADDQAKVIADAARREIQARIDALNQEKRIRDEGFSSRIAQIEETSRRAQQSTADEIKRLQDVAHVAEGGIGNLNKLRADVRESTEKLAKAQDAYNTAVANFRTPAQVAEELQRKIDERAKDGRKTLTDLEQQQRLLNNRWDEFGNHIGPGLLTILGNTVKVGNDLYEIFDSIYHIGEKVGQSFARIHTPADMAKFLREIYQIEQQLAHLPVIGQLLPQHSEGGVFTRTHLGIVAEDGPEAILPLSKPDRMRDILGQLGDSARPATLPLGDHARARESMQLSGAHTAPRILNMGGIYINGFAGDRQQGDWLAKRIRREIATVGAEAGE